MAGAILPITPDPFKGRTLGKYEILCRLSTGGMSEIFLAFQRGLGGFRKILVLKSILPDIRGEEEFVRMFLEEARITAAFNHANIAQVFDLDVDEGELFLAMEFVPGCTLVEAARSLRQLEEAIPIGFTLMAVRDTALALHYAHSFIDPTGKKQCVIHRDVAEKNIMVTYDGVTKLLDFGIAKNLDRIGRTTVGMVKGTSGYMSPEQVLGEPLDARSDVFSLGVVLHECLTGMRLFHGKKPEDGMMAALKESVAPPSRQNPSVPPALDAVVLKALQRRREDRYASALEMARALERAGGELVWTPEQSGELVQRLFAERRDQTRQLLEQAQSAVQDTTGELRLQGLIGGGRKERTSPTAPARGQAVKATEGAAASGPALPSRGNDPVVSPAVVPLPVPRRARSAQAPGQSLTDPGEETVEVRPGSRAGREVTGEMMPPPLPPEPATVNASIAPPEATRDTDDTDDEGMTIPAQALPDELREKLQIPVGPRPPALKPEPVTTQNHHAVALTPSRRADLPAEPSSPGLAEGATDSLTLASRLRPGWLAAAMGVLIALAVFTVGFFAFGLHRDLFGAAPVEGDGEAVAALVEAGPPTAEPASPSAAPSPPPSDTTATAAPPTEPAGLASDRVEEPPPPEPGEEPAVAAIASGEPPEGTPKRTPAPEPRPTRPAPKAAAPTKSRPVKPSKPARADAQPLAQDEDEDEDRDADADEELRDPGYLTLSVEPAVKVIFKSQDLGSTPLFKAPLPAGKHTLKLIAPDGRSFALPVEIPEGQLVKRKVDLSQLSSP